MRAAHRCQGSARRQYGGGLLLEGCCCRFCAFCCPRHVSGPSAASGKSTTRKARGREQRGWPDSRIISWWWATISTREVDQRDSCTASSSTLVLPSRLSGSRLRFLCCVVEGLIVWDRYMRLPLFVA
ncbi:hypothetical protein AOLI_G00312720 [Acnodon oligacanthus]